MISIQIQDITINFFSFKVLPLQTTIALFLKVQEIPATTTYKTSGKIITSVEHRKNSTNKERKKHYNKKEKEIN